jgi:uncharacterized protein YodC (DUF2158 family)
MKPQLHVVHESGLLLPPKSLEIGDIVQLKSGGPLMTIIDRSKVKDQETFVCASFSMMGTAQAAQFPAAALKRGK